MHGKILSHPPLQDPPPTNLISYSPPNFSPQQPHFRSTIPTPPLLPNLPYRTRCTSRSHFQSFPCSLLNPTTSFKFLFSTHFENPRAQRRFVLQRASLFLSWCFVPQDQLLHINGIPCEPSKDNPLPFAILLPRSWKRV